MDKVAKQYDATVHAALEAAPKDETKRYRILVSPRRYKEKLNISYFNVEIRGESTATTVIYFDAYAGNSRAALTRKNATCGMTLRPRIMSVKAAHPRYF